MARRAGREIWWSIRCGDSKGGGAKTDGVLKDDYEVDSGHTWFSHGESESCRTVQNLDQRRQEVTCAVACGGVGIMHVSYAVCTRSVWLECLFLFCSILLRGMRHLSPCVRTLSESTPNVVEEGSRQDDVDVDFASATDNGQDQLILESAGTSRNSVVPTTLEVFLQDTASQRRQDSHLFVHAFLAATASGSSVEGRDYGQNCETRQSTTATSTPDATRPLAPSLQILNGATTTFESTCGKFEYGPGHPSGTLLHDYALRAERDRSILLCFAGSERAASSGSKGDP